MRGIFDFDKTSCEVRAVSWQHACKKLLWGNKNVQRYARIMFCYYKMWYDLDLWPNFLQREVLLILMKLRLRPVHYHDNMPAKDHRGQLRTCRYGRKINLLLIEVCWYWVGKQRLRGKFSMEHEATDDYWNIFQVLSEFRWLRKRAVALENF